jgi:hypothetical protein
MSSYGVSAMRVWSSGSTFRWLALEGGERASFKLVSLCGNWVCGAGLWRLQEPCSWVLWCGQERGF